MLARCFTIDSRITAWSGGTMIMTHPSDRQGRDTSPSRSHSHRRGCCSDSRRWPGRPPAGVACTACTPPVVLPAVGDTLGLSINTTWSAQWPHSSPRLSTNNATAIRAMGRPSAGRRSERAETDMTRETGLHLVSLGFRVCGSLPVPRLSPTHWCLRHARTLRDLGACGSNVKEGSGLDRSLVGR